MRKFNNSYFIQIHPLEEEKDIEARIGNNPHELIKMYYKYIKILNRRFKHFKSDVRFKMFYEYFSDDYMFFEDPKLEYCVNQIDDWLVAIEVRHSNELHSILNANFIANHLPNKWDDKKIFKEDCEEFDNEIAIYCWNQKFLEDCKNLKKSNKAG